MTHEQQGKFVQQLEQFKKVLGVFESPRFDHLNKTILSVNTSDILMCLMLKADQGTAFLNGLFTSCLRRNIRTIEMIHYSDRPVVERELAMIELYELNNQLGDLMTAWETFYHAFRCDSGLIHDLFQTEIDVLLAQEAKE